MTSRSTGSTRLIEALIEFQASVPTVGKNCTGSTGGRTYRYADLPSIIEAIRAPLQRHGLAFVQAFDGEVLVTTLLHRSGERVASRMPVPFVGLGWQQIGSAITYARRYALSALLGIVTDEDDDAASTVDRHPVDRHPVDRPVNGSGLKAQLKASIAIEENRNVPVRPEHVKDKRFAGLFKLIGGQHYWHKGSVKERVEPLFRDLDAVTDLSELEGVPLSEENAFRLNLCKIAYPQWAAEFDRRVREKRVELQS